MVYRLTDAQKNQCAKYVYSENNSSFHERLMKPVWTKLELYIPDYICATTITTVGLVANLVPCIVLMTYSPTAQETVPSWLLLWSFLGMFTHQNLDNMDGKHARRFGVETTVTDFFDHSVDAVAAGITVINISIATKLGNFPEWMLILLVIFLVVFYSYHWQVYISGVTKFRLFDVTETQDVAMMFVIVSAIYGQDVWNVKIHVMENFIDARKVCLVLACVGGVLKIAENIISICRDTLQKTANRAMVIQALFPVVPIACDVICLFVACYVNPVLYIQNPVLLSATISVLFGKPILEIMVVHFAHSEMAILTFNEVAMVLFASNAWMNIIDLETLLIVLLILGCLDFLIYFYRITSDMLDCMGFQWFKLTLKGKALRNNNNLTNGLKRPKNVNFASQDIKKRQTSMKYLIQH